MKLNASKRDIITCQIYMFLITRSRAYPQGYTVLYGVTLWVSGVTTASADPATQGGPRGSGAPVPITKKFFHDIVVGYASSCLWTQHNLGYFELFDRWEGGDPMTMFAAFAGGPEFLVTPLLWVCLS